MVKKRVKETANGKEKAIDDTSSSPSASASPQFSDIPPEVLIIHIGSFLDRKSKARLSATSKRFYQFFNGDLEKAAIEELNTRVLRGEENEALSMIASSPERLLARGTAVDYSGRIFKNITPFQTALLSHDVTLWKKMEPLFDKLPDGQAKKAGQFKEIFPKGLPEQKPYDFSALVQIINNSSVAHVQTLLDNPLDTTSTLGQEMKAFREGFTATSMKETFFNPQHLLKAFDVYVQQYDPWSVNQLCLFWSQVVGYIQRFLPACYAQAFCQDLYEVAENKMPLARSLNFENNSRVFFPLVASSGLGFEFGVYSYFAVQAAVRAGRDVYFEKLCRANTSELLRLERHVRRVGQPVTDSDTLTSRSRCTIS